jgi:hydroxymethylglutaryl-CoA synthase
MKAGIVGFGAYVPEFRIKTETIAEVWNQNPETIKNNLLIFEKSVPGKDEDAATIAVSAAQNALARAKINPKKLGAIYVGSESHPYAVKPTASIVGEAIGAGNNYTAADLEFACKAIEYGLAIGADTAQAGEGNALEYSAAAGGAAFIVGSKSQEVLAVIDHTLSFSSDTPDFWRRGLQANPEHAGRFTGQPAYFKHVLSATENILKETSLKPTDFDYAVFHMPNGKFPLAASKKLGFSKEQVEPGLVVTKIGNTYSGSSLLGLSAVLDIAKPGQKLLVTSYGSGSGSDAFVLTVTDNIEEKRNLAPKTSDYLEKNKYISYAKYRRHMELLHK